MSAIPPVQPPAPASAAPPVVTATATAEIPDAITDLPANTILEAVVADIPTRGQVLLETALGDLTLKLAHSVPLNAVLRLQVTQPGAVPQFKLLSIGQPQAGQAGPGAAPNPPAPGAPPSTGPIELVHVPGAPAGSAPTLLPDTPGLTDPLDFAPHAGPIGPPIPPSLNALIAEATPPHPDLPEPNGPGLTALLLRPTDSTNLPSGTRFTVRVLAIVQPDSATPRAPLPGAVTPAPREDPIAALMRVLMPGSAPAAAAPAGFLSLNRYRTAPAAPPAEAPESAGTGAAGPRPGSGGPPTPDRFAPHPPGTEPEPHGAEPDFAAPKPGMARMPLPPVTARNPAASAASAELGKPVVAPPEIEPLLPSTNQAGSQPASADTVTLPSFLEGTVTQNSLAGAPLIRTDAGLLTVGQAPDLTPGTRLLFATEGLPILPATPDASLPQGAPALDQVTQVLRQADPDALAQLVARLPQPGAADFVPNMAMMVAAIQAGDVRSWLGSGPVRALEKAGKGDLIDRLGDEFDSMRSPAGMSGSSSQWQVLSMPLLVNHQIERIRLTMRRPPQDGEDLVGRDEEGLRFLVDVDMTQLGTIQIDGLIKRKSKRFDLILRSHQALVEAHRRDITGIFARSLEGLGMTGQVIFQARGQFVTPFASGRPAGANVTI